MKTHIGRAILAGISLVLIVAVVAAFAQVSSSPTQKLNSPRWSWISENWTDNDAEYRTIRADIEAQQSQGTLILPTIERYKGLWEQNPNSPTALFRWAYASFRATQQNPPILQKQMILPDAFGKVPSPRTYEYSRLRFLVNAHYFPHSQLQALGERLLRHTANDYDVSYYLIDCYRPWESTVEKEKALTLAQSLVRANPTRSGPYSALGGVYFGLWSVNHQQHDGDDAIKSYREYLSLAPVNDAWRKQATKFIKYIEDHKNILR